MRKINFLKAILDYLWIVSMPLIPFIFIALPFLFFIENTFNFPFRLNGLEIDVVNTYTKIMIGLMLVSYLLLLYCLFLFRKVLRYFQKLKLFDEFVLLKMNKIGILLIISAMLNGLPTTIYKIYYHKIEFDLGFSPFVITLALGLFFMILGEVFKIAKKAKQENDLTI